MKRNICLRPIQPINLDDKHDAFNAILTGHSLPKTSKPPLNSRYFQHVTKSLCQ